MRKKHSSITSLAARWECLPDDQTYRWIAVFDCDVEKPALNRIHSLPGNPACHAGIVNAKDYDTSLGIRVPGKLLGVKRSFALLFEA